MEDTTVTVATGSGITQEKWRVSGPSKEASCRSTPSIGGPLECALVLLDLLMYPEKPEFQNLV